MRTKIVLSTQDMRTLENKGTDIIDSVRMRDLFGNDTEAKDADVFFSKESFQKLLKNHSFFSPAKLTAVEIMNKLNNKTSDGKKLFYDTDWYKNEQFFTTETPELGTRIMSRLPVDGSIGRNILDCQYALIKHANLHLPLSECSESFNKKLNMAGQELKDNDSVIRNLMKNDNKDALLKITNLEVCKMFTPEFPALSQFICVDNHINNRRLLSSNYSWTKSITSDGTYFASLGGFGVGGLGVGRGLPRGEGDWSWERSAMFSCKVELLFC